MFASRYSIVQYGMAKFHSFHTSIASSTLAVITPSSSSPSSPSSIITAAFESRDLAGLVAHYCCC